MGKIKTAFEYVRNYQYNHDRENFHVWFECLKQHSYDNKVYNYYVSAWTGLMQYSSTAGNTEYVILESKKMEEELKRIGFEDGIYVVRLTLGQAYSNSEKTDKAITVYKSLLTDGTTINNLGKIKVYSRLSNIYTKEGMYEDALENLHKREQILRRITDQLNSVDTLKYRNHWLETYTLYSQIYSSLKDTQNLLKYNKLAEQYYYPQCFYTVFINYHTSWASYYTLTGKHDKAFNEYNIAKSTFKNNDIPFENKIRKMEIEAYKKASDYDKAFVLQKELLHMQDSLIKSIDKQNEILHRNNYAIKKALYDKERTKLQEQLIETIAVIIAILVLGYCIYTTYTYAENYRLQKAKFAKHWYWLRRQNNLKLSFYTTSHTKFVFL